MKRYDRCESLQGGVPGNAGSGAFGGARRLALLALLALLVVALTACGASPGSSAATGSPAGSASTGAGASDSAASSLPTGDGDAKILKVSGAGIAHPASLSLSQLKAIQGTPLKETFSARNSWPTAKSFTAEGVSLSLLLKTLGIKANAGVITITGHDGFLAHFTPDQLLSPQQTYPQLAADWSPAGTTPVEALLAWSWSEAGSAQPTTKLRNFVGQASPTEVNLTPSVQDVASITVAAGPLKQWEAPQYDVAKGGATSTVTLYHAEMDAVQIYYTLDGSEPTQSSKLYNPSTSYYQPKLIVPITAPAGSALKLKVFGYGQTPSEVVTVAL